MHDLRTIVDQLEEVRRRTEARGVDFDFARVQELAEARRSAVFAFEQLRAEQKRASTEMKGLKPGSEAFTERRESLREMSERTRDLEAQRREVEQTLEALLLQLPNLIADDVPHGASEAENVEVRRWGSIPELAGPVRDHLEIGEGLGIVNMEAAARMSGARFAFLCGAGARLERALAALMLDLHVTRHGYVEMSPPVLVQAPALVGTGQLPKFEDDLFRAGDHFLIPTAEVPLTNYHREEIIEDLSEPRRYCALTPCFRREAGSHGRDTRGLVRMHQFPKVELVKICRPEDSPEEHERLVREACAVLELLEIPHRVIELCSGDIGFGAQRCFDIEVWLPSRKGWVEISSCSNCGEFQARRAGIRYRTAEGRPAFAHTLNGSGVAVGRAMVALLELGQQADGSVRLPAALVPYMGGVSQLVPPGA